MIAAFLTTVLFSLSVVFAYRSARLLGGVRANFVRLCVATCLLAVWAHGLGAGLGGGAFALFFVSGCVGFGLGDLALYQALPRLGSRLSILMVQCLAAPFAALTEWLWLGTRLSWGQVCAGILILGGVAFALAPSSRSPPMVTPTGVGVAFGLVAAIGQAGGAVLSRRAYQLLEQLGASVDGGSAAYQRILGGLLIGGIPLCFAAMRATRAVSVDPKPKLSADHGSAAELWRRAVPWVLLNSLSGPVLGVACYQWALGTAPSGVVLPIVATTPLVVMPFTYHLEQDRPGLRAVWGGLLAVAGAVAMAFVSQIK
jgi:drug/metabolite transporter (DMT)-like permease